MNDIISVFLILLIIFVGLFLTLRVSSPKEQFIIQIDPNNNLDKINPIEIYDYNKTFNPLEEPTRRLPVYEIPPYYLKKLIDIPSRGYPDNFSQMGVLIREDNHKKSHDNRILRLFGRQEYPGSNKYEYYTIINNGNDHIKVPLDNKRKNELYNDDIIYVKELDSDYIVSLYKYDHLRYYPDLL